MQCSSRKADLSEEQSHSHWIMGDHDSIAEYQQLKAEVSAERSPVDLFNSLPGSGKVCYSGWEISLNFRFWYGFEREISCKRKGRQLEHVKSPPKNQHLRNISGWLMRIQNQSRRQLGSTTIRCILLQILIVQIKTTVKICYFDLFGVIWVPVKIRELLLDAIFYERPENKLYLRYCFTSEVQSKWSRCWAERTHPTIKF